jgi:molecular chaperone DnaJ
MSSALAPMAHLPAFASSFGVAVRGPCVSSSASAFVCPGTFSRDAVAQALRVQRARARTHHPPMPVLPDIRCDKDYYDVLEVSRSCSEADLKTSFRKLARKYHPDVSKEENAQERFQEIAHAYEVLSDPEMRQRYDQFGEAGVKGASGGSGVDFADFGSFSDIFETFFGGQSGSGQRDGRRRSGPQPGDDLRLDVELEFERAFFGGEEKIKFSHLENCNTCSGTGVKPGTKPRTCSTCQGQGTVMQVARTPLGMFQQSSTCSTCRGTGEIVDEYCGTCGGRGREQRTKQLMITIPPGVDTGSRLRIRNEGDAGPKGGPSGDLYVMLRIKPSREFTRDGLNISSTIKVSYIDAILGRKLPTKTVDGSIDINIPAGTQPGTVLRVAGKGMPKLGNSSVRGDQYITVNVNIPTRLSAEERRLVKDLDVLAGGSSASENGSSSESSDSSSKSKAKGKSKSGEGFFNFGKK